MKETTDQLEEILKLKARLDDIENMLHFEFKIDMAHWIDMNKVLPKPKTPVKKRSVRV